MNNNYKPMIPNNPIKFIKREEKEEKEDYINSELHEKIINNNFKLWLESPLQNKEISFNGKYRGADIYDNCLIVQKKQFINKFLHDIEELIVTNGYEINNNKQFRNEIASFIYKLSK
tara:strand:- start:18 stop:368 length:351 start_codon:yes stop_codon:yes gene_type:complete